MTERRPGPRVWIVAGLVLIGCVLGASADVALHFPGVGTAILFPPYVIVTAALLRTPPRHWWIVLVAAAAGDFLPHLYGGRSVEFVILAELTNWARSLIAVIGLRTLSDGRFDSTRGMVVYLVFAVVLAPCAAGFAGGALMMWEQPTAGYWTTWQMWSLSNAISGLTLLPLLVIDLAKLQRPTARRTAEAVLLVGGLLAVAIIVFTTADSVRPARLYWPLPFLLWAAVRFGPRGTSAALLAVMALTICGALHRQGPFATVEPAEGLLELQLFLLVVSIPLLLLSVLLRERQVTTAALAESQRRYQSIVEDQTEMICRFRPDGTYTFVNCAYATTFGLASAALSDGNVWTLVPDGVHRTSAELRAAITPAQPTATRDVEIVLPGGECCWQQWRDRGLFDAAGNLLEYQSVGRDITDRTRAEHVRRQVEAQHSVADALRQADQRKDEFLAMLGHELRTPLAPIGMAVEVLCTAAVDSDDAVWARAALRRQLAQLTRVVDDLLDVSRVTLGKIRLQPEPLDLRELVSNTVEASRHLVDASNHALELALPASAVLIEGDAVRLAQIVSNLLNNAIKYTEPGGHIRVALERDGDTAVISVRDDGIGIPTDALAEVFELFRQVATTPGHAHVGLGVGLTLVKRLVELHGGTVQASSGGPRQGTEIIVRLPAPHDWVPASSLIPPPPTPDAHVALRVLVVDDNVDIARGLAVILGGWNHVVRTANDGLAALEAVSAFDPDVVLLDIALPHMNGLEVARRVRDTSEHVLLVSMSGFGRDEARLRQASGFRYHLLKPVDLDLLRSILDTHARTARGADAVATGA